MFAQRVSGPQSSLAPNPNSSRIADTLSKSISAPWSLFENLTIQFFMTISHLALAVVSGKRLEHQGYLAKCDEIVRRLRTNH
jgi:hypothetical protein